MQDLQLTIDDMLPRFRVLLIDADSVIPNLALMKLSAYYKSIGAFVKLLKVELPYYPNRKKEVVTVDTKGYDISLCSTIYAGNGSYIKAAGTIFGGTGIDLKTKLSDKIEAFEPDYSIYPDCDTSYGFISRGCNRKCSFCYVPEKEGKTVQVSRIDEIVRHKKVKFLDNNFLQLRNHKELLAELVNSQVRCQFNQGLDIRLIDEENSKLLSKLNYIGEYIFAFDSFKYASIIEKKLALMRWRKPFKLKFFVYIHPDMGLDETVQRIELLREWECLPYIMRDLTCWESKNSNFYVDLAAWCNQPSIFKKMSFEEFLEKRHVSKTRLDRIKISLSLYENATQVV